MDHAVLRLLLSVDRLKGQPGLLTVKAVIQQLHQVLVGELAVVHGLIANPDLPTRKGHVLGGEVGRIGGNQLLVGVSGDHISAAQAGRLIAIHKAHVDHIVLVCLFGENRLEGQPALIVLGPVSIHQLGERGESKLAVVLGLEASQSLPAHKGHSFGGSGIGDFHRLVGNRGDHVAAAQKVAFAIHKAHVDHIVLVCLFGENRLEGQPALIVLGPVSIHQLGERGESKLAVVLGLEASQSLPAHKGHSFGGSGIGDFHRLVGNRGDHVAAAQKVAFAIHKAHVDHIVGSRGHLYCGALVQLGSTIVGFGISGKFVLQARFVTLGSGVSGQSSASGGNLRFI